MIFTKIDYELSDNNLKLSAECNGVLAIVEIGRERLINMFPREFGTSGDIEWWYWENMSQRRAEQMFTDASVDDITELITND